MISTITGTNDFRRVAETSKLVSQFIDKYSDLAVERLDGAATDLNSVTGAVQSLPFLSERKLVVLDSPSSNRDFAENIESIVPNVSDSVDVLVVEPKLDKRSAYYKYLKKATTFLEYNELSSGELAKWVVDYAKENGAKISFNDANLLVNRVGANQLLLKNEVDKLALYNPQIDKETIELMTEERPQSTIFELVDAALSGNIQTISKLYNEQRALKVEPQQIIAMLAWQLHILALVKTAGDKTPETIASEAGISPFVVKKSLGLIRGVSFERLSRMVEDALTLDVRLKSESLDADEALLYYLLTLKD